MIDEDTDILLESVADVVNEAIRKLVTPLQQEVQLLRAQLAAIPSGPQGPAGRDGDPELLRVVILEEITKAMEQVPRPKDGERGEKGEKGEKGDSVDMSAIITEIRSSIPVPRDGKDADLEQIQRLIDEAVRKLPAPKDGRDGKDGQSIEREFIMGMIVDEVRKTFAVMPQPKDGRDGRDGIPGEPGQDALRLEILPEIERTRSYPRGTYACFDGGVIMAFRQTDAVNGSLEKAGWQIICDGYRDIVIEMDPENPRQFFVRCIRTSKESVTSFKMPMLMYREVYDREKTYDRGDVVTYGGSTWHCQRDGVTTEPVFNGVSSATKDWVLMVRKGIDAKK